MLGRGGVIRFHKPEPAGEDLRRWRQLVDAAVRAASAPHQVGPLAKARSRCKGRLLPRDQQVVGSPFDRLARLTANWPALPAGARESRTPELAALAAECAAILDLSSPSPDRQPRRRADLDD